MHQGKEKREKERGPMARPFAQPHFLRTAHEIQAFSLSPQRLNGHMCHRSKSVELTAVRCRRGLVDARRGTDKITPPKNLRYEIGFAAQGSCWPDLWATCQERERQTAGEPTVEPLALLPLPPSPFCASRSWRLWLLWILCC